MCTGMHVRCRTNGGTSISGLQFARTLFDRPCKQYTYNVYRCIIHCVYNVMCPRVLCVMPGVICMNCCYGEAFVSANGPVAMSYG